MRPDVLVTAASRRVGLVRALQAAQARLTPRGRVIATDQAQALENGVAERHATLCDGMEHAGLDQERRALVASPVDMSWEWPQANQLALTFSLSAGSYATSVLNEILRTTEPDRHTENESAAVE